MRINLTQNCIVNKNTFVPFTENELAQEQRVKDENKLKRAVFLTSTLGMSTALAIASKKQGFSLNPLKIFKESPKNWAIFKIKPTPDGRKPLELKEKEILGLAAGSILGGLAGGAIYDKKNIKAKLRESLNQFLGTVTVPLAFVAGTSRIYNKHKDKITSKIPVFKNSSGSKILKGTNTFIKGLPAITLTFASLGVGIIAGNKVSNFINEKIYHKKIDRGIKPTDFAPHIDDLCLASSLMADGNLFGNVVSRLIPPALIIAGCETGKAKED